MAVGSRNLVRLNKLLAQKGLCSRREADKYIQQGLVKVNGVIADQLGTKVDDTSQVVLLPMAKQQQQRQLTVLLNKPLGVVSSQEEHDHTPAIRLCTRENLYGEHLGSSFGLKYPLLSPAKLGGWAVVGRLDINSTGLLVLTQAGHIAKQIIGQESDMEKEYLVRVNRPLVGSMAKDYVQHLQEGVQDNGELLQAKSVSILNENQFKIILTQGKKHQIRRMCRAVGVGEPIALKRVRIGRVKLSDLPVGSWRYLRDDETFV